MFPGLTLLAGALRADVRRLRARAITAAVCYGIAALVFLAAFGLCGTAATIALVNRLGVIEGLLIASLILAIVGVATLAANTALDRRNERRAGRAAAIRSAALAETANAGLNRTREAVPALLPAVALLSFTLTTMLLNQSRR
ncbi:MAG: hypothetical protein WAU86_01760 [Oricola sp.]